VHDAVRLVPGTLVVTVGAAGSGKTTLVERQSRAETAGVRRSAIEQQAARQAHVLAITIPRRCRAARHRHTDCECRAHPL
jgi:ABC-type lipoprotein export system ATPase subunit